MGSQPDVMPVGECLCLKAGSRAIGACIIVNPHVAEVATKDRLDPAPNSGGKRRTMRRRNNAPERIAARRGRFLTGHFPLHH